MYDCIVMLSGGKDSILTLFYIISKNEYKNPLTITYNDGFLSQNAKDNVKNTIDFFSVDNFLINYKINGVVDKFINSDLVEDVDIYTFIEVFQNNLWNKINELSILFGNIPVITGNIGYFSSEKLLQVQYYRSLEFIKSLGYNIIEKEYEFISYWAENKFPEDMTILDKVWFKSSDNLNTEDSYIKNIRIELNNKYPKITLDDIVEENWELLTRPRFK